MSLLEIDRLTVEVATAHGWVPVVQDVSLDVDRGERVGLVGESGSGKTVTCQSVLQLLPRRSTRVAAGEIRLDGQNLLSLSGDQLRAVRGGDIGMVFQEPMTSLNPAFSIGDQIGEAIRNHARVPRRQARDRAVELLDLVGIPRPRERVGDYPHQFSGGMRQRVMLAMALAGDPKLLIADEPTTALDVTIQAQVLDLIRELSDELGLAVLFVTHDLGVVADICERVVVMYAGQVVERASTLELFESPRHPYTEGLMRSRPSITDRTELHVIPGTPPAPGAMPAGCRFQPRCGYAAEVCAEPVQLRGPSEHPSRCARLGELLLEGCE
ncbi:ABC transporter ATP-binding protein [Enemella dayhoffiae]|uniref:ABC transporter ATP-binding protein n=1 Tax=Enemella dayhoffiae TaxID=2016507 RepID=A0A255GL38_9ACTN|nr:ABC transporter ATP-binding protein [Enemella dayhoffiae]OYO16545.1 ABC transporter ATP-binding protein [Enemella dayhoffiae]